MNGLTRFTRSVVVAFWKSDEDGHAHGRDDNRTSNCLYENGVLDLAKSWLLNPDLTIEYLPKDVAFLVLGDPRFIFITVIAAKAVEGAFLHLVS